MFEIINLSVSVGSKKILKNINLAIKSGELHVLMGPNGAGKTSLVMALMGAPAYSIPAFAKASAGRQSTVYSLDEKDMTKLSTDQRAKLGLFVSFQKPVVISGVTVRNLLRLIAPDDLEKKLNQVTKELLVKEDLLSRPLNENFSGGESKKIELLQAVILKPKFLILDEIDSGLDVDALKLVTETIRQMANHSGVLLITHNPRILKFLRPDRIHVLVRGCIVRSGGPEIGEIIEKKGYQWLSKN